MKRLLLIIFILLCYSKSYSQVKDTVYIIFDNKYNIMQKADYTHMLQAGAPSEKLKRSIHYTIEQKEDPAGYDFRFSFSHLNQSKKAYERFGGEPPLILKKPKSFLECKKVLDIEFFRTTPYGKVTKTFEEEGSWEQDVMIFIIDVDEIKNDSIVLREVDFSRPVKQ